MTFVIPPNSPLLLFTSYFSLLIYFGAASAEAWTLGISQSCGMLRTLGSLPSPDDGPVVAIAGVAHPQEFFGMLRDAGCRVAETLAFPDHHRYTRADLARIGELATSSKAAIVLTTEKDYVRVELLGPFPFRLLPISLAVQFDPPDALFDSIRTVLA